MNSNIIAVMRRVLQQLRRDKRFVAISLVMPMIVVYLLSLFFEGVDSPIVDPKKFVMPIGTFIIHFITYALCAIVLVRERTGHTLARMFINGYTRLDIVGGYLLAYSVLATLQSLIVLVGLTVLFQLDYSLEIYLAVYLVTWLMAVFSIGLGMLISNFARNEGQVFPMIPLVIMVSVFFSGMLLPIERLPEFVQWVRFVTPMYYANQTIQNLISTSSTAPSPILPLIGLIIYGVVLLNAAALTLREEE
jgi:ABC-2 type transport system permease protein